MKVKALSKKYTLMASKKPSVTLVNFKMTHRDCFDEE